MKKSELEAVAEEMCEQYCKYPLTWDSEKEGMELCDSDVCKNCPLSRMLEKTSTNITKSSSPTDNRTISIDTNTIHAEWLFEPVAVNDGKTSDEREAWECSSCGLLQCFSNEFMFCPHCGAMMEVEE